MSYDYIFTDFRTNTTLEGSIWLQGGKQKIKAEGPAGQKMVQIINGK